MLKRLYNVCSGIIRLKKNGASSDYLPGYKPETKPKEYNNNEPDPECPFILRDFNKEFKDEYYIERRNAEIRANHKSSIYPNSNFQVIDNPEYKGKK